VQVFSPTSVDEALEMLAAASGDGAALKPIAGGTDLLVFWHRQDKQGLRLLDLSRLGAELPAWRLTETHLELGALTTYWEVIRSREIAAAFPLLVQAARVVGAVQIQMRGTWAGNVANASPAADGVLALMAYDAQVVLRSHAGERAVPLDQFYTGYRQSVRRPDELIVALRLPRRPRQREWFYKVGTRRAQAISKVAVAVVKDAEGWRVVVNSVAPVVCRCRNLERALEEGRTFQTPGEIGQVLAMDIAPIDDLRSTARYRMAVLSRLIYFWLLDGAPLVGVMRDRCTE
jgi:CO/xanthine dehydrogenase FAD-binding subunit